MLFSALLVAACLGVRAVTHSRNASADLQAQVTHKGLVRREALVGPGVGSDKHAEAAFMNAWNDWMRLSLVNSKSSPSISSTSTDLADLEESHAPDPGGSVGRGIDGCTNGEELYPAITSGTYKGKCYKKCSEFANERGNDFQIRVGPNSCMKGSRDHSSLSCGDQEDLYAGFCYFACRLLNGDYPVRSGATTCSTNSGLTSTSSDYKCGLSSNRQPVQIVEVEGMDGSCTAESSTVPCCKGFNTNDDHTKTLGDHCPYTPTSPRRRAPRTYSGFR